MTRRLLAGLVTYLGMGWCQTPPRLPEFEVADVQVTKPGSQQRDFQFLPGGKLQVFGITMQELITIAWNVSADRVSGGPPWLGNEHYDIVAKAGHDATDENLQLMLQSLLAQRFGLKVHTEEKIMPAYALVVSKRGSKLKAADGKEATSCPVRLTDGLRTLICKNITMPEFAERIREVAGAYLDHPVVDLTGIKGAFDFTLAWTGRGKLMGTRPPDGDGAGTPVAAEPEGGLSVFDAVDKTLGLRLESQKLPVSIVVIDKVNRIPTEQ